MTAQFLSSPTDWANCSSLDFSRPKSDRNSVRRRSFWRGWHSVLQDGLSYQFSAIVFFPLATDVAGPLSDKGVDEQLRATGSLPPSWTLLAPFGAIAG